MPRFLPFSVCLVILLSASLRAQDTTFTIKLKDAAKGDRSAVDSVATDTSAFKLFDPDNKPLRNKEEKKVIALKYVETVLEKTTESKPTRLKREYEKAEMTEGDKSTTLAYQGKTLLIEKQKDDKYHFTIDKGAELAADDAKLLDKEFNKPKDSELDDETMKRLMLPPKAVAVKEIWKLDAAKLAASIKALPIDAGNAKGTGQLVKTYKKTGKQFGVLVYHVELPLKGILGEGAGKIELKPGAKLALEINVDCCIDGTSADAVSNVEAKGDMSGRTRPL